MSYQTYEGKQSRNYTLIHSRQEWDSYSANSYMNEEEPTEYPCWVLEDIQNTYCKEYYNYSTLYEKDLLAMLQGLLNAKG